MRFDLGYHHGSAARIRTVTRWANRTFCLGCEIMLLNAMEVAHRRNSRCAVVHPVLGGTTRVPLHLLHPLKYVKVV